MKVYPCNAHMLENLNVLAAPAAAEGSVESSIFEGK